MTKVTQESEWQKGRADLAGMPSAIAFSVPSYRTREPGSGRGRRWSHDAVGRADDDHNGGVRPLQGTHDDLGQTQQPQRLPHLTPKRARRNVGRQGVGGLVS